jgi:hypothetical protein
MKAKMAGAVAVVCVLLALIPSVGIARARNCPGFRASGARFAVTIQRGAEVRCSTARSVLHSFLTGHGTLHGPPNGPAYLQTWNLPYGWRCGHGAGGGACIRGGATYKTAHDYILAQSK